MAKKKTDKGGVHGSGLYYLGDILNDAEMARFGLRSRTPEDGIMALPCSGKRSLQVGDWVVFESQPRHAFRLRVDLEGKGAVGIRVARLVRTKRIVTYTIIPDNAT